MVRWCVGWWQPISIVLGCQKVVPSQIKVQSVQDKQVNDKYVLLLIEEALVEISL